MSDDDPIPSNDDISSIPPSHDNEPTPISRSPSPPSPPPPSPYGLGAIISCHGLTRLAAIGIVVFGTLLLFAWAAGWLSPRRLDQTRLIDTFEAVNGVHPGFRRNHAKGVCLKGEFDSNGAGRQFSKAVVFRSGRVSVFGRFALAGGMPRMPDNPAAVRSMALNFALPDGEIWRTGMNDIPVFAVNSAGGFKDQLVAGKPDPKTGKPDPAAIRAFLTAHPETVKAMAVIKAHPFSSGFANAQFNSLNALDFVDAAGHVTPVRWAMVPEDAFAPESAQHISDHDYLFDALIARIMKGPARWHLVITIGQPGDPTSDATLPWPADRTHIDVGTLTVSALESEAEGNCRDINFDPLVLPTGIEPSDDPLLSARSAAYSVSFTRRARELKAPSVVQTGKGA